MNLRFLSFSFPLFLLYFASLSCITIHVTIIHIFHWTYIIYKDFYGLQRYLLRNALKCIICNFSAFFFLSFLYRTKTHLKLQRMVIARVIIKEQKPKQIRTRLTWEIGPHVIKQTLNTPKQKNGEQDNPPSSQFLLQLSGLLASSLTRLRASLTGL